MRRLPKSGTGSRRRFDYLTLDFDPNRFRMAPIRRLAAYWLSKCVDGRLPRRADIRLEEIAPDLPFLYLVDVLRDPLAFRYRLVGTRVSAWSMRDYTGSAVNDAEYGPRWKVIFDAYRDIVERRAPSAAELFAHWFKPEYRYYERVLAPLSEDGQTVNIIYGALHAVEPPKTT